MVKANFFFYGSLMKFPPYCMSHREVVNQIAGAVSGKLFVFNQYYPAAVLMDTEEKIHGIVTQYEFKSNNHFKWMVQDIDHFEGFEEHRPDLSHYHRKVVPVTAEDGEVYDCWMYLINTDNPHPLLNMNQQIPNGNYASWVKGER